MSKASPVPTSGAKLLAPTNHRFASWLRAYIKRVDSTYPRLVGVINSGHYPDLGTHPDYTYDVAIIRDKQQLPNSPELAAVLTAFVTTNLTKNRADLHKQRVEVANLLREHIPTEVQTALRSNDDYLVAESEWDFVRVIDLLKQHIMGGHARRQELYHDALNELELLKLADCDDFDTFAQRATDLVEDATMFYQETTDAKHSVTAQMKWRFAALVVNGLTSEFENFKQQQRSLLDNLDAPITATSVLQGARKFATIANISLSAPKRAPPSLETAMASEHIKRDQNRPCDRCGQLGHGRRNCKAQITPCETCRSMGKPATTYEGHSTAAHHGGRPRNNKGQSASLAAATDQQPSAAVEDDSFHFMFQAISEPSPASTPPNALPAAAMTTTEPSQPIALSYRDALVGLPRPPSEMDSLPPAAATIAAPSAEVAAVAASASHETILDTGATHHLVLPLDSLTDFANETTAFQGISGTLTAVKTAEHRQLGRVVVNPTNAAHNLVSFSKLCSTHKLTFDAERDEFVATRDSEPPLVFKKDRGLYKLTNSEGAALSAKAHLTSRQEEVLRLHDSLHHPSDDVLARSLSEGVFLHSKCTQQDLRQARAIVGPCTACLAGKSTEQPARPSRSPPAALGTVIHVDIFFLPGGATGINAILLAVESATRLVAVRSLQSRKSDHLLSSLLAMCDGFKLLSKVDVAVVRADAEPGFVTLRDSLAAKNIQLVISSPERHERRAERAVRELKNYIRCTIASLPFTLPSHLYTHLVADAVRSRNVLSHGRLSKSPRELMTGSKPDVERDFQHAFGSVGYTRVTGLATKGDIEPRAELAVVVGRTIDESGAVQVWLPRSSRIVQRHHFTPVEVTATVVQALNSASGESAVANWEFARQMETVDGAEDAEPELELATQDPTPLGPSELIPGSPGTIASEVAVEPSVPAITNPDQTGTSTSTAVITPPPANGVTWAPIATQTPPNPSIPAAPTASLSELPVISRPQRTRTAPARYKQAGAALVSNAVPQPPRPAASEGNLTMRQAVALDPARARSAIVAELSQMLNLGVFARRDRVISLRVLPSKLFLRPKIISGKPDWKARLVVGGHMQDKETMGETFSPTVNAESTNVVLAIAAQRSVQPYTVDVSGAFLHVDLTGPAVHMRLSKDVVPLWLELAPDYTPDVHEDGSLVVRIRKAIYGLGESSRQWNEHLASTLDGLGYTRLAYDRSVFVRRDSASRIIISIICLHVDDLLVADMQPHLKAELVAHLRATYGKVTMGEGSTITYLGVRISRTPGGFSLDQSALIAVLDYPIPARTPVSAASSELLETGHSPTARDASSFRSVLMRILYIASKTRFDLMFAVSVLAGRQQDCTERDEGSLSQLVAYLKSTSAWTYDIRPTDLVLRTTADASYACHPDGRGHSGFTCEIGGAVVYARSLKQRLVTKSSTESELLALNLAADETLYLRNLLAELGLTQNGPTVIQQDNLSTIALAEKGELGTKRTKHFTVRHYFITFQLAAGELVLRHQPGATILADGLTKPLAGPAGREWSLSLLGGSGPPRASDSAVRGGVLDETTKTKQPRG